MDLRRNVTASMALGGALTVAAEIAVLGYWLTTGAVVIAIGLELAIGLAVISMSLVIRYRRISRVLHARTVADAAARERGRIATDMHDTLGHQLGLIALRAASLQVQRPDPAAAAAAAEIRHDAAEATAHLHDIIAMLSTGDTASIGTLVDRTRTAGTDVRTQGTLESVDDPNTMRHLYIVVREGLTNAMRHAPHRQVGIDFEVDADYASVSIRTALAPAGGKLCDRQPRGLAALGERIRSAGGTFDATTYDDQFVLTATLPRITQPLQDNSPRQPRPLRAVLAQAAVPLVLATVFVIGFYATASSGAVMEQSTYDAISVGASETAIERTLPERQAPVHLIHTDTHPATWRCRYYTDGNFPLAMAIYEICTSNRIVTRTADLRSKPWT